MARQNEWCDYAAASRVTGYSPGYLRVLQSYGQMPRSYGTGRARRWLRTTLDEWMKSEKRVEAGKFMTREREKQRRRAQRTAVR
jgi:hypothetical protein